MRHGMWFIWCLILILCYCRRALNISASFIKLLPSGHHKIDYDLTGLDQQHLYYKRIFSLNLPMILLNIEECFCWHFSSALDTETQQRVAIKRMTPFSHSISCQRTLREIRILSRMKHENVRSRMIHFRASFHKFWKEFFIYNRNEWWVIQMEGLHSSS